MTIGSVLKDHYEHGYADYSLAEWRSMGAEHKAANIMQLCQSLAHDKILEIGAGDGAVMEGLRKNNFGREWHALEISESAVELIGKKGFAAQVFDGGTLPQPDKSFDLVILSHVVEHLEHPRILLAEAARVGSHVCVEVPLLLTARLKDEDVFHPVGHINFYTARTARMLLLSVGYEVIATRVDNPPRSVLAYSMGRWKGSFIWWMRELGLRLAPGLATRIFCYHYAMVGKPKASAAIFKPADAQR